jgi:VIT1/CCC1 family predicted Fe2+/Mn2+ transporter
MKALFKTKTFWAGLAGVATGVGAYLSGEMSAKEALEPSLVGLIAIFLRHGLTKLPTASKEK